VTAGSWIAGVAVFLAALLLADWRRWRAGIWIAKPLASAGLFALAVTAGAADSAYGRWILAGLALSFGGDVLLIPHAAVAFRSGLVSFLMGHVAYAVGFAVLGLDLRVAGAVALPVAVVAFVALRWLGPHVSGPMVFAVRAYVVAISVMVVLSAGASAHAGDLRILAGATLFFVSDLAVARDRFVSPGFGNRLWGLPLYFGGQVLLALSVAAGPRPPNLVLVMIDTLRADHVGAYGYERPTSPEIDALAASGTLFSRASATSSWTKPSVGSLFTSRLPSEHGAVSFASGLDPALPTLAEALRAAGYRTYGVSGNFVHITEEQGFARGFDGWRALSHRLEEGKGDPLLRYRGTAPLRAPRAPEVNRAALDLLPETLDAPFFLYVHYMDPHAGYTPPRRFRERFARPWPASAGERPRFTSDRMWRLSRSGRELPEAERALMIDLYDAEIAAVDAGLGKLLRRLEERGYGENTVVVVVSDHGEEFHEHGRWNHGLTLFTESLRVPLVIHDARNPGAGARRDEPVDLLDVAPTLLALAGAARPDDMRGRNLLARFEPRDVVAELHPDPAFEVGKLVRPHRASLQRGAWKGIARRDGGLELYAHAHDPAEQDSLPEGAPSVPAALAEDTRTLAQWLDGLSPAGPPVQGDDALDAAALERLRALGYVE